MSDNSNLVLERTEDDEKLTEVPSVKKAKHTKKPPDQEIPTAKIKRGRPVGRLRQEVSGNILSPDAIGLAVQLIQAMPGLTKENRQLVKGLIAQA